MQESIYNSVEDRIYNGNIILAIPGQKVSKDKTVVKVANDCITIIILVVIV